MDLAEQLMAEMSRQNIDYIARYVGNDGSRFDGLMTLVLQGKPPMPLRAAWAISVITDTYPKLLMPYVGQIVGRLETFEHTGVHRLFLRYFQNIPIPEEVEGHLYDICYRWLLSREAPVAVKANCMQILYNIAQKEPELMRELLLILEELIDDESAAVRSRSRQLLAKSRR